MSVPPFAPVSPPRAARAPATSLDRLRRPLSVAIAVLLVSGIGGAVLAGPDGGEVGARRSATASDGERIVDRPAPSGPAAVERPSAVVSPTGDPPVTTAASTPTAPLGVAAVPEPGVYRYQVETTREGRTETAEETREVVARTGDRTSGIIEIAARLEGESQVSLIDWSPGGALVRSTRIESAAGGSRDCSWTPPFVEIGPLSTGSSWAVDSTCRTTVGGIDTTLVLTGSGRVVGTAMVTFAGAQVPVWQVERDRKTEIDATLDGERLRQQTHEQGTFLIDPVRGVVMRSDVTITLEGEETGVIRRTSVLREG
jgi:hypothetical protein